MDNNTNTRLVAYDPDEKITLVNRKTGKSCVFEEFKNEYLLLKNETFESIIIKQCTEEELKSYFYMIEVRNNSEEIRNNKEIDSKFNELFRYFSDFVEPDTEIPIYCYDTDDYFLHIIKYKK